MACLIQLSEHSIYVRDRNDEQLIYICHFVDTSYFFKVHYQYGTQVLNRERVRGIGGISC